MSRNIRLLIVGLLVVAAALHIGGGRPLRASASGIVISQIYGGGGNSGATYKNDFIELYNAGASAVDLAGWTVQYASSTGSTWQRTSLAGILAPGEYYLVQEAQGAGGTVSLPTPNAIGTIPMSATAGKVALVASATPLTGACPVGVEDFVGYGPATTCFEGAPTPLLSNTTAALRKQSGAQDTDNNSADFTVGAPNPRNSTPPPPPVPRAIQEIQGAGAMSPLVGQNVVTSGIVTGVKYNGFFIQTPDAAADADSATSQGIFVFTSSTPGPPAVAVVGNLVEVTAAVAEYKNTSADPDGLSMTELTNPATTLLSSGNPLPLAVTLTAADLSDLPGVFKLEKYEGMRVHVDEAVSVSPTDGSVAEKDATSISSGLFFAVLPGLSRPFREPGIETPLPVPPGITPPVFDANPERIGIDTYSVFLNPVTAAVYPPPAGATLEVTTGVTVSGITGPLDYAFRSYIIDAEGWNLPVVGSDNRTVRPVRARTGDEFTVASMNLARFFDTTNEPGVSDVVLTPAAFEMRLAKASLAIREVMLAPDIIGVQEVENISTLQALADRVHADGSVRYDAYLMEGHDVGGIDVGFLVRRDTVAVAGPPEQVGYETLFTDGSYLNDRPSLVLHIEVLNAPYDPYPVTVVVNHLRSLSDIETSARVREKRLAQALELAQFLQDLQSAGRNVVSVGDYNAFDFNDGYVDVMGVLRGAPAAEGEVALYAPSPVAPLLRNLADLAAANERYSFVFGGNAQELDHVLASGAVVPTGVGYARMNADFPESFRGDATRPERLSDHDPVVGYFELPDIDTTPPVIAAVSADPATLWAPNHKMVPVTISVAVTDEADPTPTCRITGVSGNDGATSADWLVNGMLTLSLRAERLGKNAGRTYTIGVACTDRAGNRSLGAATAVFVPHDRRK